MSSWPPPVDVDAINQKINANRGRMGHKANVPKSFLDGIPKGVWVLAGFVGADLLRKGHGRKR